MPRSGPAVAWTTREEACGRSSTPRSRLNSASSRRAAAVLLEGEIAVNARHRVADLLDRGAQPHLR